MFNLPVIITPLKTYLYGQTSFWMEVICLQHLLIEYLEKYNFLKNCRREFHFCRRKIDNTTFASALFCRREIIWVRMTEGWYLFLVSGNICLILNFPWLKAFLFIYWCRINPRVTWVVWFFDISDLLGLVPPWDVTMVDNVGEILFSLWHSGTFENDFPNTLLM